MTEMSGTTVKYGMPEKGASYQFGMEATEKVLSVTESVHGYEATFCAGPDGYVWWVPSDRNGVLQWDEARNIREDDEYHFGANVPDGVASAHAAIASALSEESEESRERILAGVDWDAFNAAWR